MRNPTRHALSHAIAVAAATAILSAGIGAAPAEAASAHASGRQIVTVCSKRAKRQLRRGSARASASSARRARSALRHRCIVRLRRSRRDRERGGGQGAPAPSEEAAPMPEAGSEEPAPAPSAEPESAPEAEAETTAQPQAEESQPISEPEPAPEPAPSPEAASEPAPEPATAPSASKLVVGIDGGAHGWWQEEIDARKELDAAVTRHEWDPSEPVDSQDSLMLEAAGEVHTRIHALLGGNELGDAAHYREWVIAFIRRYGVGGSFWSEHPELDASKYAITTFELGNEPYFGGMSASSYAETVRPTLEAVHQLGLPAKLVLPSYIYGADTEWIDTLYQRIPNLNELFYAFADHPYWYGHSPDQGGDGNSPFERIDRLRERMAAHGAASKPIFITEYGESTADCGSECVSEAEQAEHLKTMLDAAVDRTEWHVEMIDFFQLRDWATESPDREQQFGLLRQDGAPKPAYSIVREAMQKYRG